MTANSRWLRGLEALIPGSLLAKFAARPQKLGRNRSDQCALCAKETVPEVSMNTDEPRSRQRDSDVNVSAGDAPVKSATEARQAVTGHNVRYVLGFSVLVIIIAFAVVYGYYFHA